MIRLVQLRHPVEGRRIAVVEENRLRLIERHRSIYELANVSMQERKPLAELAAASATMTVLEYDPVYRGDSQWGLLPAFDHPEDPARCMVSGTGLTHTTSAKNRQAMHAGDQKEAVVTDSMRMFQWGVEGGRALSGQIGVPPEWFYKGRGTILRAHGQPLEIPAYAEDGGDEAEVVGLYIIDSSRQVRRVGFAIGNEFSDHKFEKKNYLYLAESKLRNCAIGPELVVDGKFDDVRGQVRIRRSEKVIWSHEVVTGEKNMSHTLVNLEHHHFKHVEHRQAGDAHVYFFGADAFSFGEAITLSDGDVMEIELAGFGKPLRNPVKIDRSSQKLVTVAPL